MSFMQSPHPPPPFFAHPWHTHTSSCCPHMCQVQQPGPEAQPVTEPTGGGVAPDPAKATLVTGDPEEVRGGTHVMRAAPPPPPHTHTPPPPHPPPLPTHDTHTSCFTSHMCQVKPVVVENKNAAPPPGPSEDKKTDPPVTKGKRATGAGKPPSNRPFKIPRK